MNEIAVPNNLLVHNIYDLVPLVEMYKQDAINIFNYLNGKVNKMNICKLSLCLFSDMNYGQFQYPNIINIFLGSIVDHYAEMGRDTVLSVIAMCTSHELFHADQEVNGKRYKANAAYSKNVEDAAQYNAEVFCYSHRADFLKYLGFNYGVKVQSNFGNYIRASAKEYYANSILGVFRCIELYEDFVTMLMSSENFGIEITHEDPDQGYYAIKITSSVMLKRDGIIKEDQVTFNAYVTCINEIRRGIATCNYSIEYGKRSYTIDGKEVNMLSINIVDMNYNPILFG